MKDIGRLFTVKRSELINLYFNGVLDPQFSETPKPEGGCYIVRNGDHWLFYWQERFGKYGQASFNSKEEAIIHLANLRLDYTHVPM
jgi:hypothetical protein